MTGRLAGSESDHHRRDHPLFDRDPQATSKVLAAVTQAAGDSELERSKTQPASGIIPGPTSHCSIYRVHTGMYLYVPICTMLWYGTDINGHKLVCTRFIIFTPGMTGYILHDVLLPVVSVCTGMYWYVLVHTWY